MGEIKESNMIGLIVKKGEQYFEFIRSKSRDIVVHCTFRAELTTVFELKLKISLNLIDC